MKMKKFLAALLTMSMALSVVPMTAWADEGEPVITAETGEGTTSEEDLATVPATLALAENDVAAIGETGYATLAAAVEDAKDGDEIKLLQSVSGAGIKIDTSKKSLVFDLGGNTYLKMVH